MKERSERRREERRRRGRDEGEESRKFKEMKRK